MAKKTKDKSDKYYRTCYLTNWEREGYCKEAIEFAKANPNLTNAKVKKLVIKAKTLDDLKKLRIVVTKTYNKTLLHHWQDRYFEELINEELKRNQE
jgi:ABC-type amino acid transport substrate-binding protein